MNAPVYTISLRGTGEYVPPKAPEDLQTAMNGVDIVISWDAVNQTIFDTPIVPDYYLVFYNGRPDEDDEYYYHGLTPELFYTHYGVGLHATHMFYRVRAYKYYGTRSLDLESLNLRPGMSESEVLELLQNLDK